MTDPVATDPVSAIVLAGGRSRRLGRDKRALRLDGARSQLDETVRRVALVATEVIVVAGSDPETAIDLLPNEPGGVVVIPDARPGHGPLGGICTGLAAVRQKFAIVVACDLPFLRPAVLRHLVALPRDYDLLVPRRADGQLEMLHAVYRETCRPILETRLSAGQLRLTDAARDLEAAGLVVRHVPESDLARVDPTLRSFFNVNTLSELLEAGRLAQEEEGTETDGSS